MRIKKCPTCGVKKDTNEFSKDKKTVDGLYYCCKECKKQYDKKYRKDNLEHRKLLINKWYKENCEYVKEKVKKYQLNNITNTKIYKNRHHSRKYFGGNKDKVLERDNYICQICGDKNNLNVHHKDGNNILKENPNNDIDNLITLCVSCHTKLHFNQRRLARCQ